MRYPNTQTVARKLLKHREYARIIVITGHADQFVYPAWPRNNLQAVISKNDTFCTLRYELDDLLDPAQTYLRPREVKSLYTKSLTDREAEVLALIGEGLTSIEIGQRLYISEHTVQSHRKRIASKLGPSGSELSHRAIAQRSAFFASTPPVPV